MQGQQWGVVGVSNRGHRVSVLACPWAVICFFSVILVSVEAASAQERFFATPNRSGADGARQATQLQNETNRGIAHQVSITAIEGDVSNLQGRMGTAETNIGTLQTDVGGLTTRMNGAESNISTLQTEMSNVKPHATAVMPGTCAQTGAKLRWNTTSNNWECVAEGDPTVRDFAKNDLPVCGSNQLLRSNGSGFTCVQAGSDYVAAELDPKIGDTTNNRFCRGTGSQVTCDQPVPTLNETDPQVGAVTSGKACRGDGTSIQCDQDVVSKAGDAMTGNLSVPTPVAGNHAATKSYVDAVVVAAGGGGGGAACYYTNTSCGNGWTQMPGWYNSSGGGFNICCVGGPGGMATDALPIGYAVRTETKYNANLGGLAGADAKCLAELQNMPWNGKADAIQRGILTSSNVRAFLCDQTECRKFKAFTRYGATRTQTLSGSINYADTGSTEVRNLSTNNYLVNTNIGNGTYWTGGDSPSGQGDRCQNWTSTGSAETYYGGNGAPVYFYDWYTACSSNLSLVCLVHP